MKDVRPTSGRVLQALFNILGDIKNLNFLDLFAGTGRVGIEALNRGADNVVFVESVKGRASEIKAKLKSLGKQHPSVDFVDTSTQHFALKPIRGGKESVPIVLSLEVRRAVSWLVKRDKKFDVIFADPPYNSGWGGEFLNINNLSDLLNDNGILIFEHSSREELVINDNWALTSRRDYGETCLSILHHARTAGDS